MSVVFDPGLLDEIDVERLSPAACELCAFAADDNVVACASLLVAAEDEYQARLAMRAERLTVDELRLFRPIGHLVALINELPRMHRTSSTRAA